MSATNTARAILGAGLVTLNLWDTTRQVYTGFGDPLDADKFEIKPNFEEKISESRSHLDYGQARASVVLPKPTELTIELSAASMEAMAMQFQGIVQALTQSAGNQNATDFTVTSLGVWLSFGKRNLHSEGFSITNEGATTTFVLGQHYEVNWMRGEIRFLAVDGAPAKDEKVKIAASWSAVDGKKILGGRVTQVRCQARFDGQNMVDGSPMEADVWECVLGANNGFDFLGGDFSPTTLTGKIVTPKGKTEGYEIRFPGVTA
ncbi:hypothetical protein [Comamonas terrae]|uniref:Uncharacterized protein n=1 Tax=Comamonas terrae TaxID=673548 RepID=A0ABW5ULE0_9BURK|nr:hypothetical protein [Comamonas terrae]